MKCYWFAKSLGGRLALAAMFVVMMAGTTRAQIVFHENFNSLVLGPSVNERQAASVESNVTIRQSDPAYGSTSAYTNAFSHTGPAGWTIDNNFNLFGIGVADGAPGVPEQGNPDYGVDEWEGWSFARKSFWTAVDDQGRSNFTKGVGTVAVADGDEYDDLNVNPNYRAGFMDTGMTTGDINVSTHAGQTLTLTFDSSWDAEAFDDTYGNPPVPNNPGGGCSPAPCVNNQSAVVAAFFDGAGPNVIHLWDSSDPVTGTGFGKGTAYNETLTADVAVPDNTTNVKFTFGYYDAANDWWWAVDNLKLETAAATTVWSEDFEGVALGDSVNERKITTLGAKVTAVNNDPNTSPRPNSFTDTPPAGWTRDNSGINPAAIGNNNEGVYEWEGWNFADRDFWLFASQGDAASFTKASGPFAIADSDEFSDLGNSALNRPMSTALSTPTMNIASIPAGELMLAFDSAWRPEGTAQSAEITVDYGSGPQIVLRWDSDPASPNVHGTNSGSSPTLNESVLIPLNNPLGATTAQLTFKYLNGSNNWFWAFDNVRVGNIPEPGSALLICMALAGLGLSGARRRT
jgi:hypothetical protein